MKVNEIAFSVYPVTDMEKARAFYEGSAWARGDDGSQDGGGTLGRIRHR